MTPPLEKSISITVVDDQYSIREAISEYLKDTGYNVQSYDDGAVCLKNFEAFAADIVITDVRMPRIDGLDLLKRVKELSPSTEVIIITAYADKEVAMEALRQGAHDLLEKPIRLEQLQETIKRTAHYQAVLRERDTFAEQLSMLTEQEAERWGIAGFVGQSRTIQEILHNVRKLQAAETTSVLITGESGTGKELIARAIHFGSSSDDRPFVCVNCPAIPDQLAESIFFGHVRGAFTGAVQNRKGYFELADKGTLFLDEIGDLPLELQPKLLRTLENGTFMPVGGVREKQVNVRVLAATNAALREKTEEGLFRQDLYFRLARFTVEVPPLRKRKDDIPLLANHFLKMLATEMGMLNGRAGKQASRRGDGQTAPILNPEALEILMNYHFPGNVRELKNIIEHALIESGGAELQPEHLCLIDVAASPSTPPNSPHPSRDENQNSSDRLSIQPGKAVPTPEQAEVLMIKGALVQTNGSIAAAAHLLGMHPDRIRKRLAERYPTSTNSSESDEADTQSLVLEYVKQNGNISNANCQKLLSIDRHRTSYLLNKMQKAGLLTRHGSHRGTRYYLR